MEYVHNPSVNEPRNPPTQMPRTQATAIKRPWAHVLGAALAGAGAGALLLGGLTLRLNPALAATPGDAVRFTLLVFAALAAVWIAAGALLGLLKQARAGWCAVLLTVPALWMLLLPQMGLFGETLTRLVFAPPLVRAFALGLGVFSIFVLGHALARRGRALLPIIALGLALCGIYWMLGLQSRVATDEELSSAGSSTIASRPLSRMSFETAAPLEVDPLYTPRVVLLCIDGADPNLLREMTARGELPTFAALMREGTWGPLKTYAPTLSPAIWTTLVTGRSPEQHGIHGFTRFKLPGINTPIDQFPVHAGLNFTLPRLLEALPGQSHVRVPYRGLDRLVPALWETADTFGLSAGVFQWRVTWPAEPLDGFMVAAAVTLAETRVTPTAGNREGFRYPTAPLRGVAVEALAQAGPSEEELARYVRHGTLGQARSDPRFRTIEASHSRTAAIELSALYRRYQPHLLVAGYYSVDAFNHHFARDRETSGPFAPALEERYRFTDQRLAELRAVLAPGTHLIVVSDHGFDFEQNHHTHAPPGVFLATGPAFAPQAFQNHATVYDVAPLVARLLDLPIAEDLPGKDSYAALLDEDWLASHPERRTPSWGARLARADAAPPGLDAQLEQQELDELKELGYIE